MKLHIQKNTIKYIKLELRYLFLFGYNIFLRLNKIYVTGKIMLFVFFFDSYGK